MKNFISRILISGALASGTILFGPIGPGLTQSARGQTTPVMLPAISNESRAATVAAKAVVAPAKNKVCVLVLQNERTLSGEAERVEDRYRLKRLIGETWIPADQVLKVCDSLDDAFLFLRDRANLKDPDERLRLSEWCRQHDLRERAVEEVKAAAALRPGDQRIVRMLTYLESRRDHKPKVVKPEEAPVQPIDVSADAVTHFLTKVQPILMNACVRCHNSARAGVGIFQLNRVSVDGLGDRRTTEKNLAAVLNEINPREPATSRLLIKSVSIHGRDMGRAPLQGRDTPAFRSIEQWVLRTVASNPHLVERIAARDVVTPVAGAGTPGVRGRSGELPQTASADKMDWGGDRSPEALPKPDKGNAPAPATQGRPSGLPTPPVTVPSQTPGEQKTVMPVGTSPATVPGASISGKGESDPVDPSEFNQGYRPPGTDPVALPQPPPLREGGNGKK